MVDNTPPDIINRNLVIHLQKFFFKFPLSLKQSCLKLKSILLALGNIETGERRRKMQVIENKFQKVTWRAKTFAAYCNPWWGFWKIINPRRIPICSHFLFYAFSLTGGRECSLFITVESIQPGHPRSDYLIEVTA